MCAHVNEQYWRVGSVRNSILLQTEERERERREQASNSLNMHTNTHMQTRARTQYTAIKMLLEPVLSSTAVELFVNTPPTSLIPIYHPLPHLLFLPSLLSPSLYYVPLPSPHLYGNLPLSPPPHVRQPPPRVLYMSCRVQEECAW